MQVVSHSLTHCEPGASCTRTRWQPYASIQPSSTRTPSSVHVHTPSSSTISTPASALHNSICESEPTKPLTRSNTSLIVSKGIRDVHKHKYVTDLVDAAVRSLCEIWNPHDIPTVFLTQTCSATCQVRCIISFPLMAPLIQPPSRHSRNNYSPRHRSHPLIHRAQLPLLTFSQHLVNFLAHQLTLTFLLLTRLAVLPLESRISGPRDTPNSLTRQQSSLCLSLHISLTAFLRVHSP